MPVTDRFNLLPEETKEFLVDLRPEDVKLLSQGIGLVRSIQTVSSFVKWFLVGILGVMGGVWAFLEMLSKFSSFKGVK